MKVQEIGRELGVRFVLEGSIRKAGNRVRITAQLVDAAERRPSVGRPLRPRAYRHLRHPGRGGAEDRRSAGGQARRKVTSGRTCAAAEPRASKPTKAGCAPASSWAAARARPSPRPAPCTAARSSSIRISARPMSAWPSPPSPTTSTPGYPTRPRPSTKANAGRGARSSSTSASRAAMSRWATCWSGGAATTMRWRNSHRAVELDTNYAQGHALLGMALMYSGRAAEALEPWRPRCGSIPIIPTSCCI